MRDGSDWVVCGRVSAAGEAAPLESVSCPSPRQRLRWGWSCPAAGHHSARNTSLWLPEPRGPRTRKDRGPVGREVASRRLSPAVEDVKLGESLDHSAVVLQSLAMESSVLTLSQEDASDGDRLADRHGEVARACLTPWVGVGGARVMSPTQQGALLCLTKPVVVCVNVCVCVCLYVKRAQAAIKPKSTAHAYASNSERKENGSEEHALVKRQRAGDGVKPHAARVILWSSRTWAVRTHDDSAA